MPANEGQRSATVRLLSDECFRAVQHMDVVRVHVALLRSQSGCCRARACVNCHPDADAELVDLHTEFASSGLEILAFPCNEFGQQEPGTNEEIAAFAASKGVGFTMFAKANVNAKCTSPKTSCQPHSSACCPSNSGVFDVLRKALPERVKGPLKWNFEKILVGRDGQPIARLPSHMAPKMLVPKLRKALAAEAPSPSSGAKQDL